MRGHRVFAIAACCVGLLFAALIHAAPAPRTAPEGTPGVTAAIKQIPPGESNRVVGTIQYDNDVPFSRDGQDDGLIGNRFVPPAGPHSIATVSFRVAGNYVATGTTGSIVATVWDVNTGTAMVLSRVNVTNAPGIPLFGTGTITDVVVVAPLGAAVTGHTGDFIGGLRNTGYAACAGNVALNTTCDGVALTAGTVDPGSGFNAVRLPFTSGNFVPTIQTFGSSGAAIASTNAIFRVTGDNLPVELMTFSVE